MHVSSTSTAALLPSASGLWVWAVWFFFFFGWWKAATQWSLLRMRTDTVARPGTIDKGYFYSVVWLEGRDNDYNTCIILKGFSCCPLPWIYRASQGRWQTCSISNSDSKTHLHYSGQSVRLQSQQELEYCVFNVFGRLKLQNLFFHLVIPGKKEEPSECIFMSINVKV